MGYCYITGRLKNGHISFKKCDGRSSICVVDYPTKKQQNECKRAKERSPDVITCLPYSNITRCNECPEYAHDYKTALTLFKEWLLTHKNQIRRKEYDSNTETCLGWAECSIGDFKMI